MADETQSDIVQSSLDAANAPPTSSKQDHTSDATKTLVNGAKQNSVDGRVGEKNEIIMVDWNGPDDPENPKNWTFSHKWAATAITSAFTFISPVSSSMLAPVSGQIASDFGITSNILIAMCTSIFVLAFAVGPLFLGPLSEVYGRSRTLQLSNLIFLVFNLACGFSRNITELLVFRFLSGIGGSAPQSIGGGVLGDCWKPEERGLAVAMYSLAPLIGPVAGPVAGAWIGLRTTWRWVLWAVTIADGIVQLLGILYLQETYAPILLERKAQKIRAEMGMDIRDESRVRTPFSTKNRDWKAVLGKALTRPFQMFFREPILQLIALYAAFIYGILYLALTTIPGIFQGLYHESIGISGLHFIALGVGLMLAAQVDARLLDKIYKYLSGKNDGVGKPEFRLPILVPGSIILPIGLFLFGWSAQQRLLWVGPDFGLILIGIGTITCNLPIQTYTIDAFTLHAASALAATTFLRSICGFGFPLFAPKMFEALNYGPGCSLLAGFAIVIGCPAPFLLWRYGERLRLKSQYAPAKRGGA